MRRPVNVRIAVARIVREGDGYESLVELGVRRQVERAVAEVGVRVGVEHDREVAPGQIIAAMCRRRRQSVAACGRSRGPTWTVRRR